VHADGTQRQRIFADNALQAVSAERLGAVAV
jgi:hypothetical protein